MSLLKQGSSRLAEKDQRDDGPESDVHRADTVPPPASGDAYSAETVVRQAPPEILEAIKARKREVFAVPGSPRVPQFETAIPLEIAPPEAVAALQEITAPQESGRYRRPSREVAPAPAAPSAPVEVGGRATNVVAAALWALALTVFLVAAVMYVLGPK